MYTFKNRSHYAQPVTNTVPATWEQAVVDRVVEWEQTSDGLSYRVIGKRVNHNGSIVIPEHSKTVLYEGLKKSVHTPDSDILQALADAWAALIVLPDGEAYRGHNGQGEGPESPLVSVCNHGPYPYFVHS